MYCSGSSVAVGDAPTDVNVVWAQCIKIQVYYFTVRKCDQVPSSCAYTKGSSYTY